MKRIRILSMILLVSMAFSLVSCKKNKKKELIESIQYRSGQEIQETDPFFEMKLSTIKLPIDETREVSNTYISPYNFYNDFAIVEYSIEYQTPDGAPIYELPYEEQEKYITKGTGIFDGNGNYLMEIPGECYFVHDTGANLDGNICILGNGYNSDNFQAEMKIIVIDNEGKKVETISLKNTPYDAPSLGQANLGFLPDGRYSIQENGNLHVFDKKGEFCYTISEMERTIGEGIISQNGNYYVLSTTYDFEDGDDIQIKEVNIKTGELGKSYDASALAAFDKLTPTLEGLFVISGTGCYEYDIVNGKLVKFFDWSDTDVNRFFFAHTPCDPIPKNTDEIYAIGLGPSTWPNNQYYLIHLTRAEKNPHAGKKMVVVGGINMSYDQSLMTFVADYNNDPENKCRAVLVDYSENLEIGTDLAEIERRVFLDILAGEGPDILVNFSESSSFQTEAVMEDLNLYLDGSDGISRDQYFDNIFQAQEKEGKLYHMPIRFSLEGLQANTEYIQNTVGWTFEEFEEAASKMPDNVMFVEGILYKDFLTLLLQSTMTKFVDFSEKKVDFQNSLMKSYLQMSMKYGVERIPDDEGDNEMENMRGLTYTEVKFYSGLIALRKLEVTDISNYCVSKDALNGNSTFLGYPSPDGSGAAVKSYLSIGIVSTSKNKELAWDFLRDFLAFNGNPGYADGFSVNRELFDMECEMITESNNLYFERMVERTGSPDMWKGFFAKITEEDINELRGLIEAATTTISSDKAMLDVITEEAAAYFAGDRSEDDVLANIQNRCSLIVNERG